MALVWFCLFESGFMSLRGVIYLGGGGGEDGFPAWLKSLIPTSFLATWRMKPFRTMHQVSVPGSLASCWVSPTQE